MIRLMLQYIQDKLEEKGADNPVVKVYSSRLAICWYNVLVFSITLICYVKVHSYELVD